MRYAEGLIFSDGKFFRKEIWTPTVTFSLGSGSGTVTTTSATITLNQIGNMIFFSGIVNYNVATTSRQITAISISFHSDYTVPDVGFPLGDSYDSGSGGSFVRYSSSTVLLLNDSTAVRAVGSYDVEFQGWFCIA